MDLLHALVAHQLYIISGFGGWHPGRLDRRWRRFADDLVWPSFLFRIHPATAVGTDLLYAVATKTAGASVHGVAKSIDWRIVGLLALGSLPATVIVILSLAHFGAASPAASKLISITLAIALLISATVLFLKQRILNAATHRNPDFGLKASAGLTVATGFVVSKLAALSFAAWRACFVALAFFIREARPLRLSEAMSPTLQFGVVSLVEHRVGIDQLRRVLLGFVGIDPRVILGSVTARLSSGVSTVIAPGCMLVAVGLKMLTS